MQFCKRHWDAMRAAVEAREMSTFVAPDGATAVAQLVDQAKNGMTVGNFDPLMAMHNIIVGNLMRILKQSALYLLTGGAEEDPIDVEHIAAADLKEKYRGRTWPRCPICYANIAHEISCSRTECSLAKVDGYDVCIEWTADGVRAEFEAISKGGV